VTDVHVRRPNRRPIRGLSEMVNELCPSTGKRRYVDQRSAARAMAEIADRDPDADRLNTYRCGPCADWHTGHLPEAVR
jgi:hypothetical protein